MAINDKKDGGLIVIDFLKSEIVAPATIGVETVWVAVALTARRTMSPGLVALIIGSLLNAIEVFAAGQFETGPRRRSLNALQIASSRQCCCPQTRSRSRSGSRPSYKFKYVAAV
jgi:hypothetical protein